MNLFFEEDGTFKAGTVLSGTDSAFQVELPTGKRTKVKSSHVLLKFESPSPAALMEQAQAEAATLDLDFLWEVAGEDEFGFAELAHEYYGAAPSAVQGAAIILRLHSSPVYFHRKGRGRYRPAPAEILKAALAAVERKRKQEEQRQRYVDQLVAGELPEGFGAQAINLLIRPDKNSIEWKALDQAAGELHMTPLRLLISRGAIASPWRWHVDSFYAQNFPRGAGFPAELPAPAVEVELPLAEIEAFSIDDSSTTEIDDAFSLEPLGEGRMRLGIHIAAPAVGIPRGHPLDQVARSRMSTVYAPGLKTTMLPDDWVDAFSLNEGRVVPVVSLYAVVEEEGHHVVVTETRVERMRIAANLRYDKIDAQVTEEAIENGTLALPFSTEIAWLWRFARKLMKDREAVRGRPEPVGRVDWSFDLDGEGEDAHVSLKARRRGAPLDLLVAELAIFANSSWGAWLENHKTTGIYRSQRMGRVRMSTTPGPHDGIGVEHYAWSSSPLRRYVDLVNQRQIVALALGQPPAYPHGDADMFAIVSSFDAAYAVYAEFQSRMERYWGLRWLVQEGVERIGATVIKGDVVRLDGLPFVQRMPGMPELPRGQKIELDVLGTDFIDLLLEARLRDVLSGQTADDVEDEEEEVDVTLAEPTEEAPADAVDTDGEGAAPSAG